MGCSPLYGHVLCVSGRLCFELVQKAAVAGTPVLVGVGAPSSAQSRTTPQSGGMFWFSRKKFVGS